MFVRFQFNMEPIPTKIATRIIMGAKNISNHGGPTDIFCPHTASTRSGYKVPNITTAVATTNSMLFNNKKVSREKNVNPCVLRIWGTRNAYNNSEPPTTKPKKPRINIPRVGSTANACTEVNTPERTINVPNKLKEKANIASRMVQLLNTPRFSDTAKEWINAVPTSHGKNEAFSTGSQNHQPPQPNS